MRRFDSPARRRSVALAVATVAAGLAVHFGGSALPRDLRDIVGDMLWAYMIVWWVSALLPTKRLPARAVAAYAVCAIVEFSQLIHTPALDAFRTTTVGHLVLGSGFDGRDLVAYLGGVCLAAVCDRAIRSRS